MAVQLSTSISIRSYLYDEEPLKRYIRLEEMAESLQMEEQVVEAVARDAGATYKINEGKGGTVLVNLEIFDEYMEQFRQDPVPMKHKLYEPKKGE